MKQGFSVVEVLLAVVILSLFVMATVGAVLYGEEGSALSGSRNRAMQLASEGLEADRNLRDANFANLTIGTFGLTTTGNAWHLSGSSDLTDIFTRTQMIATASGDDNRRDVTSSATWQQNLQRTGSIGIYTRLTNWFRKFGNWAGPSQSATLDFAGANNGMELAQKGAFVYLVRDGGTPNFAVINVSTPDNPVTAATLTLTGNLRNIAISGNFAYVTSTADTAELQIVDISNPAAPTLAGSFSVTGTSDGSGVAVVGTTVFVTTINTSANNFVIIDASSPASPTQLAIMSLAGPLHEVTILGNNAYVTSQSDTAELAVIDISNPSAPSLVTTLNLAGTADARAITGYRNPDTVFIGRGDGGLDIVDVTSPASPSVLSSFATGAQINDLSFGLSSGQLIIAANVNSGAFRTLDVSTLTAPGNLGTMNSTSFWDGVIYDQVRDRVYAATQVDTAEFVEVKPL